MILDKYASIANNAGMAKRRSNKLTDQLRQAIDDSGLTRYRISQLTGIDESQLAKFYNGKGGLSVEAFDALGECLKVSIKPRSKPTKKGT